MRTVNHLIIKTGGRRVAISRPVAANARHDIGNNGAGVRHAGYGHRVKGPEARNTGGGSACRAAQGDITRHKARHRLIKNHGK